MLNHRSLAVILALLAAGLGYLAGPAQLVAGTQGSAAFRQFVVVLVALHVIGLLVFAIWQRRSDWHLVWTIPVTMLISVKLMSRVTAAILLPGFKPLLDGALFPALYFSVTLLGVYVVCDNRRLGIACMLCLLLGGAVMNIQLAGLATHFMPTP
jgi:hypothetical protein